MANNDHFALLKEGVEAWNAWRGENPDITPDLHAIDFSGANLSGADLSRANLIDATLTWADLSGADLCGADLRGADLSRTNLIDATLSRADLMGANLSEADLSGADLSDADFSGADLQRSDLSGAELSDAILRHANLRGANLSGADLSGANLTGCHIHAVSAWGLTLSKATKQKNLIITEWDEPDITVDSIEVAQFVYLLLHNQQIRDVIDTITSKAVLILGRFAEDRKAVLDAMRDELRNRGYLPILFDFEKSANRDITETISLLARMARFVLADITDARSIPQELSLIVPDLPSVPVQPLLLKGSDEYSMFEHFTRYPWVLPVHRYDTLEHLIADLGEKVIHPAEIKVQELRTRS